MNITYCGCFIWRDRSPVFLPQVAVKTHATLFSSTSRTVLTQQFVNPNKTDGLKEVNYTFPLYDGVSVVGFTCDIAGRIIKGVVKEREQAKQEYDTAKANDQFAGLLQRSEKSDDVFMTSLGNVPAGATVSVEITYLDELKHDAEVDGLRYTVPSIIAPRYGTGETMQGADNVLKTNMSITVDAEMPSAIKSVQSPSHAVSVSIGTTSVEPDAEPSFTRASASLSLSSPLLTNDFILQIIAADLGQPSAMLETHPDLPNHRALMTTLVPKFGLPPIKPEIVFLCDRSGSMEGRIGDLKSALRVFLKSLPVGAKFNICSFGSSFKFLWDKSSSYTEKSLEEALKHVDTFQADFGGTQIHGAMKESFARRFKDIELEVIMLTDGQIWDQGSLFDVIREEVASSEGAIRVFTLGVGSGASSSLIEGVARAGNGASQTVSEGEKMDKKVIRTLKASLSPHVTDYTLEVKYEKDEEDDFELIEKVMTNVSINTDSTVDEKPAEPATETKVTTSLFDPSYKDDTTIPEAPSIKEKYAHLPAVPPPSYLQAPYKIPQLFAFNRTTIYVLFSDATPGRKPKSVVLRGTSRTGPLELEIEIQHLREPGQTIHQLAARKAVQDLESDGGWLAQARTDSGKPLKEAKESQFSDLVEREAVRLGTKYQVSGKWCSFVAIEDKTDDAPGNAELGEFQVINESARKPTVMRSLARTSNFSGATLESSLPFLGYTFKRFDNNRDPYASYQSSSYSAAAPASASSSFGYAPPPAPAPTRNPYAPSTFLSRRKGLTGSKSDNVSVYVEDFACASSAPLPEEDSLIDHSDEEIPAVSNSRFDDHMFEAASFSPQSPTYAASSPVTDGLAITHAASVDMDMDMDMRLEEAEESDGEGAVNFLQTENSACDENLAEAVTPAKKKVSHDTPAISPAEALHKLVALQSFAGNWTWSPELEAIIKGQQDKLVGLLWPGCVDDAVINIVSATICVILFFRKRLAAEKETWEMVVEKAEDYLQTTTGQPVEELEKIATQGYQVKDA